MQHSDTSPPQDPRVELEVRIVAWLLGEASAFEAAQLAAALKQDAELAAFCEDMRATIGLVQAAYPKPAAAGQPAAEEPKLSRGRRRALLARFKVLQAPFASAAAGQAGFWIRWGMPLKVAAACLVFFGAASVLVIPSFVKARTSSMARSTAGAKHRTAGEAAGTDVQSLRRVTTSATVAGTASAPASPSETRRGETVLAAGKEAHLSLVRGPVDVPQTGPAGAPGAKASQIDMAVVPEAPQERLTEDTRLLRRYGLAAPSAPAESGPVPASTRGRGAVGGRPSRAPAASSLAMAAEPTPPVPAAVATPGTPPTVYLPSAGSGRAAGQEGALMAGEPASLGVLEAMEAAERRRAGGVTRGVTVSRDKSVSAAASELSRRPEQPDDAYTLHAKLAETAPADAAGRVELTTDFSSVASTPPTAGFPVVGVTDRFLGGKEQAAEREAANWDVNVRVATTNALQWFGHGFAATPGQPGASGAGLHGVDMYFDSAGAWKRELSQNGLDPGVTHFGAYATGAEKTPSSLFGEQHTGQGGGGGFGGGLAGGAAGGGYGGFGGMGSEGLLREDLGLASRSDRSAPASEGKPRRAGSFTSYGFDNRRAAEPAADFWGVALKSNEQAKSRDLARSETRKVPQLGDAPVLGQLFKARDGAEKEELAAPALAKGETGAAEKYPGVKAVEAPAARLLAGEEKIASKAAGLRVASAPKKPAPAASPAPAAAVPVPPPASPRGGTEGVVNGVSVVGYADLSKAKEAGGRALTVNGPAPPAPVELRTLAESVRQVTEERVRGVELKYAESGRARVLYDGKEPALSDSSGKPLAPVKGLAQVTPQELDRLERVPELEAARRFTATARDALKDADGDGHGVAKAEAGDAVAAPARRPAAPRPAAPPPPPEISALENPFSTFSLNVSDVSFKLAAASLENGAMPEPAAVRPEEFINAFNYRDPAPVRGARLAFAWERARYPFAHNRDVLRFAIQTAARGREPGKPLNLVVLLDNSGSMERPDRVQLVREAVAVLAQLLQPQDRISVVAFARTPRLWVDGAAGGDAQALLNRVLGLNPYGGTNLELAMGLAYATAEKHFLPTGNNRVILLTDGAANLGEVDPESLKRAVEEHRRKGIALDCFGVGWEGYNDDLLEALARNGDGRYGFLNDPEQAGPEFADQLAGALNVAAADVKAQVEFNPRRVVAYRQIGYARHQLTKEQFRDNTVDAAEIGAAESGNALYLIQVNAAGSGPLGVVRVRYKVPSSGRYVEQQWTLPYEPVTPPLEHSGPAMRLAAVAAGFAEWLAGSPYAAEVSPAALQAVLRGVPETYAPDPRPQRLAAMLQQARSISGQ